MKKITTYRQLEVWQRAIELVEAIYLLTKLLPADERYGLISQTQRASVSIPANIAEGWGRSSRKEYLHHLSWAKGSLMELETLLIVAARLGFVSKEQGRHAWELSQEVGKMLTALMASLRSGKGFSEMDGSKNSDT